MSRVIGIDLGTTNSVVAYLESGEPRVITNEEGARLTPSVVGFAENGEVLVGEIARRQAVMNPDNTVYSVKRFMGRRYSEVQEEAERVNYPVVERSDGDVGLDVGGKIYSPPEVSARILLKLKRAAELHLGETVTDAVITVPAYFNDAQRKATRDAGEIAGLNVRRIINEPTAAALCYGLERQEDQVIAVYDLGGGTLDVSILEVGDDVVEVLSTAGDLFLGGDNFDQLLVDHLLSAFEKEHGMDVSKDRMVLQRLREAAEKAKKELSSIVETEVNLPFLTADETGPKHLNVRIARAEFENMLRDLAPRCIDPCERALKDAEMTADKIDEVVLVGGSTRIPFIQEQVTKFFGQEPHRGVNPDEVVALGAAVQGAVLTGELDNILLLDVVPLTLGVETSGGVMTPVITRNTTIPTRRTKKFSTVTDNQTTIEVKVFQGERTMAADNRSLGRFELSNIPKAPRAVPEIELTFDVDANGILKVSAEEKKTGQKAEITIREAGGLSQDEIRRAVQDAKASADEDEARRKRIAQRNKLEGLRYELIRQLREEDVEEGLATRVEEAIERANSVDLESAEDDEVKAALDELLEMATTLGAAIQDEEEDQEDEEEPAAEDEGDEEDEGEPTAEDEEDQEDEEDEDDGG